jgi:hypothetical protein
MVYKQIRGSGGKNLSFMKNAHDNLLRASQFGGSIHRMNHISK